MVVATVMAYPNNNEKICFFHKICLKVTFKTVVDFPVQISPSNTILKKQTKRGFADLALLIF